MKRSRKPNEHGFTLVEVLVVIVILGVLAAVVVFAVGGITDKGSGSAEAADRRAVEVAEEAHLANAGAGVYASEAGLVAEKHLRSVSTRHSVCLATADDKSYVIIAQGGPCPGGFDFNGTVPGAGSES